MIDHLFLQSREALGDRVVPTVAFAAHRRTHSGFLENFLIGPRRHTARLNSNDGSSPGMGFLADIGISSASIATPVSA